MKCKARTDVGCTYLDEIRRHWRTACLLALSATWCAPLSADLIFWTGGDGVWDNSDANWSPSDEPDPDDDVIIGGGNVTLGSHNAIESLAILSGASLRMEHYSLGVADQVTVSGNLQVASNSMSATPPLVSLSASDVHISSGGTVRMANAIEIEKASGVGTFEISNGGTLFGNDNLHFADQFSGTQTVLVNHGTIGVGNVTNSIIPIPGAPPARTLHITAADAGSRFDLDGNGTGILNIGRNGTLNVDGTVTEFKGQINLGHNSTLDISNGWTLGESGGATLTVDNGFVSGGILGQDIPADVATIKGGQVTMNHPDSLINMVDDDGGLVFDAPFHASRGTIQQEGTLTFNAPTFIGFAVDFQNAFNSDLIVNSVVEVVDADWDWDSTGSGRTVTINEGGELRTNFLNSMADDLWSANMVLNGGKLHVETLDDIWGQNAGTIVVNPSNTGSTIDGGILFQQTNGSLHVEQAATLNFNTPSRWSNGTLRVDGFGFLNEPVEWAGGTVIGDGILVSSDQTTVTADTTIGVHRYGLNQSDTLIEPGVTLTLDVHSIDTFPGGNDVLTFHDVTVESGVLDLNVDSGMWRLSGMTSESAGVLKLHNVGSGVPKLQGSALRTEGTGHILVDGNAQIFSAVELGMGTNGSSSVGLLIYGDGGTVDLITGGLTLDGGNIHDSIDRTTHDSEINLLSPLTVTGDSIVDVEIFDWDGSTTTVMPNGVFRMNSGSIESGVVQRYDNQLAINSGEAIIELADHNSWTMNNVLNLNNTANKVPVLAGDDVSIGDDIGIVKAMVNVGGTGISEIAANVTYESDAEVNVAAGATLRHRGAATFNSVNGSESASFSGPGSLVLGGTNTFNEFTTLGMSGGSVDLDNSSFSSFVPNNTHINDLLIITAASLEDYGTSRFLGTQLYSQMFIADNAGLAVQLDGVGNDWTINDVGIVNYNGNSTINTFLSGDDVNMNGTLNINGHGASSARMDIAGTVNLIGTDVGFRLGGGSVSQPNRLEGGLIEGTLGVLSTTNNRGLVGHGIIHSKIQFFGDDAQLVAEGGALLIQGEVLDVGVLGTNGIGSNLNMGLPWNTQVADQVRMNGGWLTGALITNSGANGIRGFGEISADVINHTKIIAEGGTLELNQPTPTNLATGLLHAAQGDLRIHYGLPTSSLFGGTVRADDGFEFFADQLQMFFLTTAEIDLDGGTFRANRPTQFNGSLSTIGGLTSRIDNDNLFTFAAGSQSQLNGNLELVGSTRVENGASVAGTGFLVNSPGSTLQLDEGAVLGVVLENHGTLALGNALTNATGEGAATHYLQGPTGVLNVELLDLGTSDFDNLLLSGSTQLSGDLNVSLLNNFMPELGDEFAIITAPGGVVGSFDSVSFPTLAPGLAFGISYDLHEVLLRVEAAQLALCDFNGDGLCDVADLDSMQALGPLAVGTPAAGLEKFDLNGDGAIDLADRDQWLADAATENGLGSSYALGDANLDGVVDGTDFLAWNGSKFTPSLLWSDGDFNADGVVDGLDYVAWNSNKFTSINPVPEPHVGVLLGLASILATVLRRRPAA